MRWISRFHHKRFESWNVAFTLWVLSAIASKWTWVDISTLYWGLCYPYRVQDSDMLP